MLLPRVTFTLFGLLFVIAGNSQTTQDSIDLWRDMRAYYRVNKKLDYDSILNFMPPKFFTVAPKNLMKNGLKSTFESEDFRMSFDTFAYKSIQPLVKFGNTICTMVQYEIAISITYVGEQDSSFIRTKKEMMSEKYGENNVHVSPANNSKLEITLPNKKMFALREPEWDSWKFLEDLRGPENDAHQLKMLDMVILREVLDYYK